MSVFEKLSVINVNDKKSKKNNLDYLSWAFAWSEVKKYILNQQTRFIRIKMIGIITQTVVQLGLRLELLLRA